ncbi:protein phosphatase 1 regulatory subunit 3B [Polymixia lowei]
MFQTNCSSELGLFPPKSTMPIDMAIPIYLSKEEFGYRKTPKPCEPRLNPCLRFEQSHCFDQIESKDGGPPTKEIRKAKKRVSFADHKGLSLTKVKVFSEANDPIDIPLNIQEMLNTALTLDLEEDKLVLDFTQPSADYLMFRQRLEIDLVCLEHCMLKERGLAGTVKVKNISFEKSVKVRVTFDTWKSYMDVECMYVRDTYPGTDYDTFCFEVLLPNQVRLHEHIAFAVCYEVSGCMYWDSNQGKNYRIIWSTLRSDQDTYRQGRHSSDLGIHFDRYGSPTCSHGIFPDWPSYAGYENIGPYY